LQKKDLVLTFELRTRRKAWIALLPRKRGNLQ